MASTGEAWRLGRRPALDGLRGIAVLLVLADHGGFLPEPTGSIGVTVFFVLSGFLITRVIMEARADGRWSFPQFMGARAARLLPALAVMVTLTSAAWIGAGIDPLLQLERAARALLYGQNFFMGTDDATPFRHTWSLAVEEQFYLLWPLVLPWVLRVRRPVRAVAMLAGASLVLRFALFGVGAHELAQTSLPTNAFALLLGCGLAVTAATLPIRRWMLPAGGVGLVAVIAIGPRLSAPHLVAPVAGALCSTLLVCGSLGGHQVFEVAPLRFVGRISYALYLWHYPLLATLALPPALTLGLTFGVAWVSTAWLEEPLRRAWRRRLLFEVDGLHVQSRVGGSKGDGSAGEPSEAECDVAAGQVA